MPAKSPVTSLQEVVDAVGVYPPDAYLFVQQGLSHTVEKIHGKKIHEEGINPDNIDAEPADPPVSHHISGRDLCYGLREVALQRWGLLARTVLERWNITTTLDFGRIVFAMVDHQLMQKTEDDTLADFRQVYDFSTALESDYRISDSSCKKPAKPAESKP
jgi:uncharacterized repeat protein (TIGR04138 family)